MQDGRTIFFPKYVITRKSINAILTENALDQLAGTDPQKRQQFIDDVTFILNHMVNPKYVDRADAEEVRNHFNH